MTDKSAREIIATTEFDFPDTYDNGVFRSQMGTELADTVLAALDAAGLAVVPVVPTPEMCQAVWNWSALRYGGECHSINYDDSSAIYRVMLAASKEQK